jgi:hypothetical protein
LLYKPVCKRSPAALAYGKKIKLNDQPPQNTIAELPSLTVQRVLNLIKTSGRKVLVEKEALIYRIPTTPEVKLEFAKLKVSAKTYFSLSIETHEETWIKPICQHLLGHQVSCDYVTFLKGICPL